MAIFFAYEIVTDSSDFRGVFASEFARDAEFVAVSTLVGPDEIETYATVPWRLPRK